MTISNYTHASHYIRDKAPGIPFPLGTVRQFIDNTDRRKSWREAAAEAEEEACEY